MPYLAEPSAIYVAVYCRRRNTGKPSRLRHRHPVLILADVLYLVKDFQLPGLGGSYFSASLSNSAIRFSNGILRLLFEKGHEETQLLIRQEKPEAFLQRLLHFLVHAHAPCRHSLSVIPSSSACLRSAMSCQISASEIFPALKAEIACVLQKSICFMARLHLVIFSPPKKKLQKSTQSSGAALFPKRPQEQSSPVWATSLLFFKVSKMKLYIYILHFFTTLSIKKC